MKVGIVDYQVGNLGSVQNAFSKIERDSKKSLDVRIESDPCKLGFYDKLLLPGVGAFGDAMNHLRDSQMLESLNEFSQSGKALLGICLGMQLLFDSSEEFGFHQGLGLIEGKVVGFDKTQTQNLKIPHMGWNRCILTPQGKISALLEQTNEPYFFYFVHSFHAQTKEQYVLAYCEYGYPFPAIVNKDNIFGIQAHPEKSHDIGLKLLENFLKL